MWTYGVTACIYKSVRQFIPHFLIAACIFLSSLHCCVMCFSFMFLPFVHRCVLSHVPCVCFAVSHYQIWLRCVLLLRCVHAALIAFVCLSLFSVCFVLNAQRHFLILLFNFCVQIFDGLSFFFFNFCLESLTFGSYHS